MRLVILIIASIFMIENAFADRNKKPYRMVCYFGSWAAHRRGDGLFTPENIDAQACTHLIYAFAKLENDKIVPGQKYLDLADNRGQGFYKRFNALRNTNPELTTLIAIGGWSEGFLFHNFKYSKMAKDPAKRKVFVTSVVEFLKEHDFDGLEFDWEYPVLRDGVVIPEDKVNFVILLKELKAAFEPHGFILTAAVSAEKPTIDAAYDIPQVSKYLDIINIMTYDFNPAWTSTTRHNTPLYARPEEIEEDRFLNVDYAIQHWIKGGADKKKITMGMALYGRCFRLADKRATGLGAPSAGEALPGPFSLEPGIMGFNELCLKNKQSFWTTIWNDYHLAPYMYQEDQWCGFEDTSSLAIKVDYLKAMGLSGAMVWSLDTDDFKGLCFGKKFPLVSTIVDGLKSTKESKLPTTPKYTPTSPTTPGTYTEPEIVTGDPALVGLCKAVGDAAIPNECQKYVTCVQDRVGFIAFARECPPGTAFDPKYKRCDFPEYVPGCEQ